MENTNENKAKFFAQYWGQMVLSDGIELGGNVGDCESDMFLELKPISSITNEDAQAITIYWNYKGGLTEYGYTDIEGFKYYTFSSVDFLRSKGYAMPWMQLRVENLIEYGWIRLATTP